MSRGNRSAERLTRHHLMYEKRDYRRNIVLHQLRCLPGLIIPISMEDVHRPLHRMFPQPVPLPDRDATKYFLDEIVLPYDKTNRFMTVDQAIGWFAITNNEATAEHLQLQKDFILERVPEYGEYRHAA